MSNQVQTQVTQVNNQVQNKVNNSNYVDKNSQNKEIGIKVRLLKDYPLICETLERIGIINKRKKEIYPSCYIRKYNNEYYLCHFKEFFLLQNREAHLTKIDLLRRSTIAYLLQKWGLLETYDPADIQQILHKRIDILPHEEKKNYKIIHKYKKHRFI
ncbi:MAG: translational repressor RegA [Candidatus Dojkabacteria bacterium]|nr:translational repressor RegA [Candidatus Dojkabacteria bacterium]